MAFQTINWTNSRSQTLPVKIYERSSNPAQAVDASIVQSKIALVNNIYRNTNLAQATEAVIFRNPSSNKIDGMLFLPNDTYNVYESNQKKDAAGIDNVLSKMGKDLSQTILRFAGRKQAPAAQQHASVKAGLSVLA